MSSCQKTMSCPCPPTVINHHHHYGNSVHHTDNSPTPDRPVKPYHEITSTFLQALQCYRRWLLPNSKQKPPTTCLNKYYSTYNRSKAKKTTYKNPPNKCVELLKWDGMHMHMTNFKECINTLNRTDKTHIKNECRSAVIDYLKTATPKLRETSSKVLTEFVVSSGQTMDTHHPLFAVCPFVFGTSVINNITKEFPTHYPNPTPPRQRAHHPIPQPWHPGITPQSSKPINTVRCTKNSDCKSEEICYPRKLKPNEKGRCSPRCPYGMVFDKKKCTPQPCSNHNDCKQNMECYKGKCQAFTY